MTDRPVADGGKEGGSERRKVPLARGLSTKLLVLTILFVLLAEVLIFIPSIANFRLRWLEERLGTAAAVAVVLMQGDSASLPRAIQNDVLMSIGAKVVAVRDGGVKRLLVVADMPPEVDEHIDLAGTSALTAIRDALGTAFFGGDRMLRVFGKVGDSDKEFELIIPDEKLRDAMLIYSRNVAFLSLLISLITATLVFQAINWIMIRPVRDMTRSMLAFSEAPDDPNRVIRPERRGDEIGVAERELADMQSRLQRTLAEQKHLADLGLAVSKINHDMRNILASAQLMSGRLRMVKDPTVQTFAPRLLRALDRAVAYSEGVLAYGRTQEPAPVRRRVHLHTIVNDVEEMLNLDTRSGIEFRNLIPERLEVDVDPEQFFRVISNLCRNSVQAMSGDSRSDKS